jgi:hypothetical protein
MNTKAIKLFIVFISIIGSQCKEVRQIDFNQFSDKIDSIIVYDGLPTDFSAKDLDSADKAIFNVDIFKDLVPHIKYSKNTAIWKGSSIAIIYLSNGNKICIQISYYGGFFKVIGENGYYYFEGDAHNKFINIYNQNILQGILIPKRVERNNKSQNNN